MCVPAHKENDIVLELVTRPLKIWQANLITRARFLEDDQMSYVTLQIILRLLLLNFKC
jgi:hypothetical protein